MKLIRHILSHTMLIGFVGLMVVGFYYRAVLFPVSWNQQISQQLDRVPGPYAAKLHAFAAPATAQVTQRLAVAPSPESAVDPVPVIAPEVAPVIAVVADDVPQAQESVVSEVLTDKPATETMLSETAKDIPAAEAVAAKPLDKAPLIAQAPVVETVVVEQKAQATPTPDTIPVTAETVTSPPSENLAMNPAAPVPAYVMQDKPAATDAAQAPATVAVATPPLTQAALSDKVVNDDDEVVKGSSDRDFVGVNELLLQARTAYGRGDLAMALKHYLALSEQESDNPDVFGELGNVYYVRGNFAEAGQAYYEAALRLLEQGQMGQIHYLVRVIEGLSPDNAVKLKQRLTR